MNLSGNDAVLWTVSLSGQLALLAVLIYRRIYRTFPIFTAYVLFSSVSDISVFLLFRHASPVTYFKIYFANNVPEFLLELGVLIEVAKGVLSPVGRSLPKISLIVFAGMLVSGTLLAILLSLHSEPAEIGRWSTYFLQINFTFAILRLIIFLAIVSFSQMLGIGWGNHVLQLATGFASYSFVILLVALMHRFLGVTDPYRYHMQDEFGVIGWCASLGYWSYSLAKKEAPRKEFSPRMATFLVSIADGARQDRIVATRSRRK
jgi:hypothetical protein